MQLSFETKSKGLEGRKRESPGGPLVRASAFTAEGPGSIPGPGTKTPEARQYGQKKKEKEYISFRPWEVRAFLIAIDNLLTFFSSP